MMVAETEQVGQFLLLRAGRNCQVALPLQNVVEVTPALPIESVSRAPAFVRGVSVVRASAVVVVDLALILGLSGGSQAAYFVILRVGGRNVALAVASVVGIVELQDESLQQAPPLLRDAPRRFIEAMSTLDGELLVVLSGGHLVPEDLHESILKRNAGGR